MNIHNESSFLPEAVITNIENKYNAKYVFESCLKNRFGAWTEFPVAIFYTEEAHPEGSNYFGFYRNDFGDYMITNGISATEDFKGIRVGEDIYYSRYRHDYREFGPFFVDGGRDYIRYGGEPHEDMIQVKLRVNKDKLEVVE